MYQFPWPTGTVFFTDLPTDIQAALMPSISSDGTIDEGLIVHRTATEGPYIEYSGYKIRATIETTSPTTYTVRFA